MRKKGMTLLEVIIVIVIIGVLAVLGVAHLGIVRERTLAREAISQLRLIREAEKMRHLETNSYVECGQDPQDSTTSCNNVLGLDLPEGNWDYSVEARNGNIATGFIAIADRKTGHWSDCSYAINDTSNDVYIRGTGKCPLQP